MRIASFWLWIIFLTPLLPVVHGEFVRGDERPDGQPRRSFDLRQQRLIDQLDAEELKVLLGVKAVLSEQ